MDRYVTNLDSNVYCIRDLPEEVIAVLFAYYSRSNGTLRENLERMLPEVSALLPVAGPDGRRDYPDEFADAQERASKFHERWVVGYGHGSVAEHAVAHIAVEDVSIQVAKVIEDCRLAAYTEKSTRYVRWDRERIYQPLHCLSPWNDEAQQIYRETVERMLDTYDALFETLQAQYLARVPRENYKTEAGWKNSVNGTVCDIVRYLLPIGALTNLGITVNGRAAAHMIKKLRSHALPEARELGARIHAEVAQVLPTLVKYCDQPSRYRTETPALIEAWIEDHWLTSYNTDSTPPVSYGQLVKENPDEREALWKIAAAILYSHLNLPYDKIRCRVRWMDRAQLIELIQAYVAKRSFVVKQGTPDERVMHEQVLRAFEEVSFTSEFVCDYGAWRDIQRHRMASQDLQPFSFGMGFEIPEALTRYDLETPYRLAMSQAGIAFKKLRNLGCPWASYVLPLGWRVRSKFTWNLRELDHFIRLRSYRNGNPSYRRLAQHLHQELERRVPFAAELIPCDYKAHDLSRH